MRYTSFVLKNEEVIPVEVKNKERVAERDLKGLLKFCSIAEINEGFVVSRGDERSIETDGVRIEIVPVTKFFIYAEKKSETLRADVVYTPLMLRGKQGLRQVKLLADERIDRQANSRTTQTGKS